MTARPRRRPVALLVLAGLVGVVLWAARPGRPPAPASVPGPPSWSFRFAIPEGQVLRYRFASDSSQTLSPAGRAPVGGHHRLDGLLALAAAGPAQATGQRVVARLERLDAAELEILGSDLSAELRQLSAQPAAAVLVGTLDPTGRIGGLAGAKGASPVLLGELAFVLSQLEVQLAGEGPLPGTWLTQGRGLLGIAERRYQLGAAPHQLTHRLAAYPALDLAGLAGGLPGARVAGGGSARLDARGFLSSLASEEQASAGGAQAERFHGAGRFTATLEEVSPRDVPGPPAEELVAFEPRAFGSEAERRRRLLEGLAQGFTRQDLELQLALLQLDRPPVGPGAWFMHAAARVSLEPDLVAELGRRFRDPRASRQVRRLALDLLVAAGSPEAQRLLASLAREGFATGREPGVLDLQQLGLVAAPEPEVVQAARDAYASVAAKDESSQAYRAAAFTAAAVAFRQREAGDLSGAAATAAPLLAALEAAAEPAEQATLLRALGNAGDPGVLPLAERLQSSQDPLVRQAAAVSLRRVDSPAATSALVGLVGDRAAPVQVEALGGLDGRSLPGSTLAAVCSTVVAGRLTVQAQPTFLSFMERRLDPAVPQVDTALQVLGRSPDGDVRSRAFTYLRQLAVLRGER
jgi:HEAT repeat protein